MKKTFGWLILGVMAVMFITDVPSGYAIFGTRIARAVAARRAEQKMAASDEAKKDNLQTAGKTVDPGDGYSKENPGNTTSHAENLYGVKRV